jgi:hypothetical protein
MTAADANLEIPADTSTEARSDTKLETDGKLETDSELVTDTGLEDTMLLERELWAYGPPPAQDAARPVERVRRG